MDIRGLGYVTALSTDLEQWREYAIQVLGLMIAPESTDDVLLLKLDERCFRIAVEKSDRDGFGVSGWEVADQQAFDQAVAGLEAADVDVLPGEIQARRVQALAKFRDPEGNRHEIFWGPVSDYSRFVSPAGVKGFVTGELGLGHVVLPATAFDRCREFYTHVMGFGLSDLMNVRFTPDPAEPDKRLHFLHCNNARHHSLAIFEMPSDSGCVHMMLEVEDVDEVGRALDRQQAHGVKLSATLGRHINDDMVSFYMNTPSGFDLEYGSEGLVMDWDKHTAFGTTATSHWGHDFSIGFRQD
ncbi:VOC family protein [Endozoicomonas lisbonensis]|uniref:3,4-dihydroxy-9,10-secoandrosta-1,3, 5(10)-triene-9,17-dione 4,5-dioxygenase n=1 Tax=Endozoicomonas lisbonensis TaxID=3120522 RepID=A0ABV2SN32_9GAMM